MNPLVKYIDTRLEELNEELFQQEVKMKMGSTNFFSTCLVIKSKIEAFEEIKENIPKWIPKRKYE